MAKPWESDSCSAVQAYFTVYPVAVAAALWCGIEPTDVHEHLALCTESTRGVFKHPYIKCLEPRCRAIHNAIEAGLLPYSRENGKVVQEHVAPERRHVSRQHLKDWIAAQFPADKPAFLFDEVERSTHPSLKTDVYLTLQAERDALKARIEKATAEYLKLREERDGLRAENTLLKEQAEVKNALGPRAETTYLNILGAMVEIFLSKTPAGKPHSVFTSRTAVIDAIVAAYDGKPGISKRGLEQKFADARRSLSP